MTATRYFALALGVVYVIAGILGFVPGAVTSPAPEAAADGYGRLFGLFPINGLHNIVHLVIGAWGLYGATNTGAARMFARGLAIIFGVLTILGLIPGLNTLFGLVPLFGHDVWLHALTAIGGAYFGWFHREAARPITAAEHSYAGTKPPDERI